MHIVPSAPRPTLLDASEDAIQRAVVDVLERARKPGVMWNHIPSGGLRNPAVAGKLKGQGHQPGWPDLILVREGRVYGLELKTACGRVSATQTAVHEGLTAAGATVAVAYGLDAAIAQLKTWELIR
jgi:hypothetical protein